MILLGHTPFQVETRSTRYVLRSGRRTHRNKILLYLTNPSLPPSGRPYLIVFFILSFFLTCQKENNQQMIGKEFSFNSPQQNPISKKKVSAIKIGETIWHVQIVDRERNTRTTRITRKPNQELLLQCVEMLDGRRRWWWISFFQHEIQIVMKLPWQPMNLRVLRHDVGVSLVTVGWIVYSPVLTIGEKINNLPTYFHVGKTKCHVDF